jgi:hypothetical protein
VKVKKKAIFSPLCFEKIYVGEIRTKEYLLPKTQRKKTSRPGKIINTRTRKRFSVTNKPSEKEKKV